MTSTSSPSPLENIPNWLDLPPELTATILKLLGPIEILNTARKVCVTWRKICNDPSMWKSIDMRNYGELYDFGSMCRLAVDLSCGLLEKIRLDYVCTEQLLHYIADRSPQLRSLQVAFDYGISESISEGWLVEVAKKLLNLEELHLFFIKMPTDALECFGRCCPQLKSLTYNIHGSPYMEDVDGDKDASSHCSNDARVTSPQPFKKSNDNQGVAVHSLWVSTPRVS